MAAVSSTGHWGDQLGEDALGGRVAAASSTGRRSDPAGADAPESTVASVGRRAAAASPSPANAEASGARAGLDASAPGNTPADALGGHAPEVHDGPSVSADNSTSQVASATSDAGQVDVPITDAPDVSARRHVTLDAVASLAARSGSKDTGELTSGTEEAGFFSSLAGLSSGGILRGASDAGRPGESKRSSYEETKAELAKMMSALNAKSLAARERNGARQAIPTPPEPDDVPRPPDPDPIPPAPPAPSEPEVGGRSRLMAAFDALTGPVPGLRAEFDDAVELPARKPAESWAELETAAVVESPADKLFGTEPAAPDAPRSSLGAAFAEFDTVEKAVEKKVTEPVKETVQETSYDQPIGPERRPAGLPRRGEKSSATIASLLTEAMAAYQSTAEDSETRQAADRLDAYAVEDAEPPPPGVRGRHRSPE